MHIENQPMLRAGLAAVAAGAVLFLALTWALRAPSADSLTPAQKEAYEQGFHLCYQRIMQGANPQGNDQWNALRSKFEVCTAQLGVPTKWDPKEKKWRWEVVTPTNH